MRSALLASLVAVAAPLVAAQPIAVQPVAVHLLDVTDAVGIELASAPDWKPPPALYWAGVGVDVVAVVGGGYVLVQGLRVLSQAEGAGLAGPAVLAIGGLVTLAGGAALGLGGYDLVRVMGGDNPALARAFDPDRVPPRSGPPRYPVPGPPPGPRY